MKKASREPQKLHTVEEEGMRRRSMWVVLVTAAVLIAAALVMHGSEGGLLLDWLARLHGTGRH